MCTHSIHFYGEISKIITQLSQNTLLICSTEVVQCLAYDLFHKTHGSHNDITEMMQNPDQ